MVANNRTITSYCIFYVSSIIFFCFFFRRERTNGNRFLNLFNTYKILIITYNDAGDNTIRIVRTSISIIIANNR